MPLVRKKKYHRKKQTNQQLKTQSQELQTQLTQHDRLKNDNIEREREREREQNQQGYKSFPREELPRASNLADIVRNFD